MIKEIKELYREDWSTQLNELETELASLNQQSTELLPVISKKLNIFQRLFRTLKFRQQEEAKERKSITDERISELIGKLTPIKYNLDILESKKTLQELGLDIKQAIELLESKGVPVVLDQTSVITDDSYEALRNDPKNSSNPLKSTGDLVLIHKTDFIPSDNEIKTAKNSGVKLKSSITIDGVEYEYEYPTDRNTVHFAVNHEVTGNTGGNWDNCKYAVIVPFDQIPQEQYEGIFADDTFTHGDVALNKESYILCPEDEIEEISKKNPNVHVVGYQGENAYRQADSFLVDLGYQLNQNMGSPQVGQEKSVFSRIVESVGLETTGVHRGSQEQLREERGNSINRCLAIIDLVKEKCLLTPDSKVEIDSELQKLIGEPFKNLPLDNSILAELGQKGIILDIDTIQDIQSGKIGLTDALQQNFDQRLEQKEIEKDEKTTFSTNEIGKRTVLQAKTTKKDEVEQFENRLMQQEKGIEK